MAHAEYDRLQGSNLRYSEMGSASIAGQPHTLSRTPSKMVTRPPEFGEQTDEVLAEFGFTADEIGTLKQDKVVLRLSDRPALLPRIPCDS